MARVIIPVTNVTTTAAAAATEVNGDATNQHYVANNGSTWIEVKNADSGGPHTVTIGLLPRDGQAVTGKTVSVPASSSRRFRLGDPKNYGTRTNIDVDSSQLKLTAYKIA